MNFFGENLQFYRKRDNLTQEQLAERLEVSRQTISKWESGATYAEMEKILQLCDIFSCDMDTLLRKNASENEMQDNIAHRLHMKKFRKGITMGVVICLMGIALHEILAGFGKNGIIQNTVFMSFAIVSILIFVVHGIQNENYKKRHPVIKDFYAEEEKEEFEKNFPVRIAIGIGLILIGVTVFGINAKALPLREGMNERFYYGIFMCFVTVASGILVYNGMRNDEYDVKKYNKDNNSGINNNAIAMWSGCIMIIATIIFLIAGFMFNAWKICWIVYPIGGLLCGIVSLVLGRHDSNE